MRPFGHVNRRQFMGLAAMTGGLVSVSGSFRIDSAQNSSQDITRSPNIRLTPRPAMLSGVEVLKLDLGGSWNVVVQPPLQFSGKEIVAPEDINHISVPNEWSMQGVSVPENGATGYWRTFEIPTEWARKRVKLRCDAVFSFAEVYLNGKQIGQYEGGFTPFEFDVTKDIQPGQTATIALRVKEDTQAATLSAMIPYAQHELGGITRDCYLFPVPEVNIFRFQIETQFDDRYENAVLGMTLGVGNQSHSTVRDVGLQFRLTDPEGNTVPLAPPMVHIPKLLGGQDRRMTVEIPITRPVHWENEHPRLYSLAVDLSVAGSTIERAQRRVGFRQVEIRGTLLLLNGQAIKLRGVERHETDPLRGRAQRSERSYEKELRLLREANINWVFTSHYPVPEDFIDLCDEVGLLVTEEVPFVWVGNAQYSPGGNTDPSYYNIMSTIAATILERDRSHPSIIFWQIGDECTWGRNFASLVSLVHAEDPTRPVSFSWESGTSDFFSQHYPSLADARSVPPKGHKPVIYDQYCHVNNYNRHEHLTDPGLRDYYGHAIAPMWSVMYSNPGILGGAIWAWRDDIFYVPSSGFERARFRGHLDPRIGRWKVGYGPWGIVDLWLRKKPEFWNVKKAYSPVHILRHAPISSPRDGFLRIPVENRYNFTNLNELRIEWSVGVSKGTADANVPARAKGEIEMHLPKGSVDARSLTLKIFKEEELVDAYNLPLGPGNSDQASKNDNDRRHDSHVPQLRQTAESIVIRGHSFHLEFDRKTGLIVAGGSTLSASILGGPYLGVTPLELVRDAPQIVGPIAVHQPAIMSWAASGVTAQAEGTSVLIRAIGSYPHYQGNFTIRIESSGEVTLRYRFDYSGSDLAVREIGLLFDLPAYLSVLRWKRQALWSYYPPGHIGRPQGIAPAFRNGSRWPRRLLDQAPAWPWELDETANGTNDFRSSKYNILEASLTNPEGLGIKVESDGRQNVRAWFDHNLVRLLVSDFSNGGGEPFLRMKQYAGEQKTLRKGDIVSGIVDLKLTGGPV